MSSVFSRLYRVFHALPLSQYIRQPIVHLAMAYVLLGLVYLIARLRPHETYIYFFAWKLALLNGLIFLALSPNEPKMRGVMVGTVIALAITSFGFYLLRVLGAGV